MACIVSFTMLLKRYSCTIPLVLLYIQNLATVVHAQDNQKRRHEGHHHKLHIPDQRWDYWSEWSPCSVDCGSGVTTRSRDCRSMFDGTISERCRGKREEVKLCEITGCIKQVERSCRELEQRMYRGKRYRWIPYAHPSRVCEMACRPVGAGFYLGLGKNVSDGTPCGEEESQVCITGQCRSIGCDRIVESGAVVDACGVCDGDGDTCKRVHKTFTDNVRFGYHTIATVPRGSTKIFIKEHGNSRNYLAVKATDGSFQINTGYRLSRFGDHPGAGTLFTYNRNTGPDCPDECIRADGPIDVSVDIMMLAYRDNDGVEYSYSVPASYQEYGDSEGDESPGVVFIDGDADTTTTTPVTTIKPDVVIDNEDSDIGDSNETIIIETDPDGITNRTDALQAPKPGVITEEGGTSVAVEDMYNNDNRIPSLYSWTPAGYSTCSETCGQGKQSPIFECIVTDKKVKVEKTFCSDEEKPYAVVKECTFGPCPPSWQPGPWSKCSVSCGTGYKTRQFVCTRTNGERVSSYECGAASGRQDERSCDMGSCTSGWYYTEWPEKCPVSCGYGTISRGVHCFSDTGNERTACPDRERPQSEKTCRDHECRGFWLTGPWSECNATCGMAYQNRAIACASKRHGRVTVVSESACVDEERPSTYMSCDYKPCQPEWYMNKWNKCSVTCGTGQMSRDIRCLDEKMQSSTGCDATKRPADRETCTERRCPLADESRPTGTTERPPTSPAPAPAPERPKEETPAPGCTDKFTQCSMVVQARLCQYKYYQKICCGTCELVNSKRKS